MSRWEGVGSAWGKVHGPQSKERYSVSDIMAWDSLRLLQRQSAPPEAATKIAKTKAKFFIPVTFASTKAFE